MRIEKTWDEIDHKFLRFWFTGLQWKPRNRTWLGMWFDPFLWSWKYKGLSFIKPWYVFGSISGFFALLLSHHAINEAAGVWGIVIPLGLAAVQTWVNLCTLAGGPEHEVESFYVAQAGLAAVNVALSAQQHAQREAAADYERQVAAHKEALTWQAQQQASAARGYSSPF